MYAKVCVYFIHSFCFGASEGRAGRQLQCSDLQALGLAFRAEALDVAFANGKLGETFYTSITYIYIHMHACMHVYHTLCSMMIFRHIVHVCSTYNLFTDDLEILPEVSKLSAAWRPRDRSVEGRI